ncbi:TPR-like protein [Periconia macrospinosa]|uniref:TPR-like protein n=1 Tax=Periconia macrospinosa TaxID=97972 RepID=A0A2V1DSJ9_9PLEO|nr:TPR-like protein [Periconia macrospinosa]
MNTLIQAAQHIIDSAPENYLDRAAMLHNLESHLVHRAGHFHSEGLSDKVCSAQFAWEISTLSNTGLPMADEHKMKLLASRAVQAYNNHKHTGEIDSINEAVAMAVESIQRASKGTGLLPALYSNYGVMLVARYQRIGDMADLEAAIRAAQQAVDLTPNDHPDRPGWLNNLGNHLEKRYRRTGNVADLREAIQIARQVINSTPDGHPDRKGSLYQQTGNMVDLEEAIRATPQAIDSTLDNHPYRADWLNILGNNLECRYKGTGDIADLEAAIRAAQQAVDLTPDDHPDRPGRLSSLGNHLECRYERIGDMANLEAAIRVAQQAVNSTPNNHPSRAGILSNLGTKRFRQYKRTGDITILEEAIQTVREATDLTPDGHPDQVVHFSHLGNMLGSRYQRRGNIQAVDLTPDDHPDRPGWLSSLGNHLECRYERIGDMADLEAAIRAAQQAVNSTPNNHPDYPGWLSNLGTKLFCQYECTGNIANLEAAIRAAQQAVDLTPDDHPDRPGRLSSLGNHLEKRYRRTGNVADLREAIQIAQQAIDSTPDGHPDRVVHFNHLGNMLGRRYQQTDDMADLEAAIQAAQQAIDSTPENHPDRAARLTNFGSDMADLEAAIQAAQQAINLTPENHLDRPSHLTNLGSYLESRHERTGEMADLEAAIQVARQAVDLTPGNHPGPAAMNNLGNVLARRYEKTRDMSDLEAAIHAAQQAVDSTPHNHPDRAMHLTNLGSRLESRHERTGDIADLKKSGDSFLTAWKCETGIPFYRVQAAARCVDILALQEELGPAAELAVDAINLLPTISNRSLQRSDQQYVVSYFSGLAASACSVYLRLGLPEQALEILERGRTVILSQLIGDRSDISTLSEAYPEIAGRFQSLLEEINAPLSGQDDPLTMKHAQRRRDSVAAFELCVQNIRNIPGYERFLLGLTPAEMCACAMEGPIVVVNVTTIGSHAIVVSSSEIKSMELPKLSASDAWRWLNRQWNTDRKGLDSGNKGLQEYLDWLWQSAAGEARSPRIWWIGTGLASSMPFHAAGNHKPGLEKNLFKRVISSYTPSIKALAYSRERLRKSDVCGDSVLLATMTTTPGLPTLGGVEDEKKAILKVLPTRFTSDVHDHPSNSRIVQSLEHCSIAHFACHGLTNYTDPSKSGLVFQKQDDAGRLIQDTMTVQHVSELKLEHARLAYLSACSTAENGAARLRDEVIHIVSGFQIAGFAHVVGCQWPSEDAVCVEVAKAFYAALFGRDRKMEDRDIALGLHEAKASSTN